MDRSKWICEIHITCLIHFRPQNPKKAQLTLGIDFKVNVVFFILLCLFLLLDRWSLIVGSSSVALVPYGNFVHMPFSFSALCAVSIFGFFKVIDRLCLFFASFSHHLFFFPSKSQLYCCCWMSKSQRLFVNILNFQ